jgi:hypothetical protein
MGVQLVIRDGNPYWYLSPDIWVVPGNDPNGPIGSPIAGQPAYLWAHVSNTGDVDANGARVDFYWANPALQVLRSNATFVGSANVDVPAGGGQDALCLVPWTPIIVNGGHECLVAVVNHPADPLPDPPPDDFNPPLYRQVAQKNLTVFVASKHAAPRAITISGGRRTDKAAVVTAEVGGELDAISLGRLGFKDLRPTRKGVVEVGLTREPRCVGDKDPLGSRELEVRVSKGESAAVFASIRAKDLAEGEYQLVHLVERNGDKIVGGLAFVVVADSKSKEKQS